MNRLIHRIGWHTLISLLLLTIFLSGMSYALSDMLREAEPELFVFVALAGMFLGWGLAAARPVPGWLAALLATILGFELVILQVGNLTRPLIAIGQGLMSLGWQFRPWSVNVNVANTALPLQLTELWLILNALFIRLWNWFAVLPTNGPTFDPVVTLILWSLVLWGVSIWAAWGIRRLERPLLAILPAGTILATAAAFSLKQIDILLLVLGATLLLIGLTRNHSRERRWETNHIDFAPDIKKDIGSWVTIITLTLVMTAWLIPSFSVQQISNFARQVLGNKIGQVEPALGLTNKRDIIPDQLQQVRAPGLPRSHLLSSGPELSTQIALIINTGQTPVDPANTAAAPPAPRYYWRSLTYDVYNGRGWHTGQTQQIDYKAGEPTFSADVPGRHILRQTVQAVGQTGEILYAAGDLVTVDQNFSVSWRGLNDAFATIVKADTYQVDSLVTTATEAELQAAGTNYPDRILRRYLYVPDGVPPRVKTLAHDLTATAITPYDRAKAIETYLRTYPYTLDLPAPPVHRDIVDYFLFDLQQGYCDYYATSMVVLARSVGLPARLAIGYATGTYNPAEAHYLVTEAEAHSWPEIYFPDYGWVRFEPTAARPVSTHSEQASLPEIPAFTPNSEAASITSSAGSNLLWWVWVPVGVLLLLVISSGTWLLFDMLRLRNQAPATAVTAMYNRLYGYGKRLSVPTWQGNTPHEFAETMAGRIESVAQKKRWQKTLIPATQEVQQLTSLYVQTTYSNHPPNQTDQRHAIKIWQRLRLRMWLAWASARVDTLFKNRRGENS